MRHYLLVAATAAVLQMMVATVYFSEYFWASIILSFSSLLTILGLWLAEFESRLIAIGEPIPALRLPVGWYRVVSYIMWSSDELDALVFISGRVRRVSVVPYYIYEMSLLTLEEVKIGAVTHLLVTVSADRAKRVYVARIRNNQGKKLSE